MNKQALIDAVAERTGMSKQAAGGAVNAIVEEIQAALGRGDSVQLVGFGTFEVRERAARQGRDPQSGGEITIPARTAPVFRAGRNLKEAVQGKG